ncbi:MAG: Hsp20/alpha crystallin family protein [Thermoguttaceae bacterium]
MVTRWEPFGDLLSEMDRLRNEMNRLFGRVGFGDGRRLPGLTEAVYPPMNLWEDESNLYVECELPGMDLNDLEIYVNAGNQLSIKGERKQPLVEKGTWHRQDCGSGKFARVFDLPSEVNADQVHAEFKDGVLTITMPKSEAVKPRRIEVKAE